MARHTQHMRISGGANGGESEGNGSSGGSVVHASGFVGSVVVTFICPV